MRPHRFKPPRLRASSSSTAPNAEVNNGSFPRALASKVSKRHARAALGSGTRTNCFVGLSTGAVVAAVDGVDRPLAGGQEPAAASPSAAASTSADAAIHRRVVPCRARYFKRLIKPADVELCRRRRRGACIAGKPSFPRASVASRARRQPDASSPVTLSRSTQRMGLIGRGPLSKICETSAHSLDLVYFQMPHHIRMYMM